MSQNTLTSIVTNVPYAKQLGIPAQYYRWRSCNPNYPNRTQTSVGGFTPADQYQKLKLIQNTNRIYASLYVANLAPLTAYTKPISNPNVGLYGVCWNQMSDRPVPSVQRASVPTGYNMSTINRRHTSVTSSRPGCQTPGGKGCDIKHNSYDRYLNRLKGKAPMRRGVVPPTFGKPITFNPAYPIYGGKTTKTNIVNGCDCPIDPSTNLKQDIRIYNNPLWQPYPNPASGFSVGSYVYAIQTGNNFYTKAQVISINNGIYTIRFENGTSQIVNNSSELLVYFPCNCNSGIEKVSFSGGLYKTLLNVSGADCSIPVSDFIANTF